MIRKLISYLGFFLLFVPAIADVNIKAPMRITGGQVVIGSIVAAPPPAAGFVYYRAITIDHTKVQNVDQTNFAVLVSTTISSLKTSANGGRVQNSNGFDVGFYTNNNCSTGKMNWETEIYTASSGLVIYWVNVASLSHSSNTTFYLCYDNPAITTDQSSPTATWESNYVAVYHFPNGSSLNSNDSTGVNNGTPTGVTAGTGQIDGGIALSGSSQYETIGNNASLQISGDMSIESWLNPTNYSNYNGIVGKTVSGQPESFDSYLVIGTGIPKFFRGNTHGQADQAIGNSAVPTGTWTYVVMTSSATGLNIYQNGTIDNVGTPGFGYEDGGSNARIGSRDDGVTMFTGTMDEVRISKVLRDADYIKTEYNAQSAPNIFESIGAETPL